MLIWSIIFSAFIPYAYILCEKPCFAYPFSMLTRTSHPWVYYVIVFSIFVLMVSFLLKLEYLKNKYSNFISAFLSLALLSLLVIDVDVQPAHDIIAGFFMMSVCLYIKLKTLNSLNIFLHIWTSLPFVAVPMVLSGDLGLIGVAENIILYSVIVSLNIVTWNKDVSLNVFTDEGHGSIEAKLHAYMWAIGCVVFASLFGAYRKHEIIIPIIHFMICYFCSIKSYTFRHSAIFNNGLLLISGPFLILLFNMGRGRMPFEVGALIFFMTILIGIKYMYHNQIQIYKNS